VVLYAERFILQKRRIKILVKLYVDGGTKINCTCLIDPTRKKKFVRKSCDKLTNNELEYKAIINAVIYAKKIYPKDDVTILSDSKLAVSQINGEWEVHENHLKVYCDNVVKLIGTKNIIVEWVPREMNLAGVYLEGLSDRSY
jgi:ribonuclease HI